MTPTVRALLIANVGAFFLQSMLPGLAGAFVFVPQLVLLRPWAIVTYMFLHSGLMHLLFNMMALFFFGPRVEDRLGSRSFGILYFVSGITGALLSFIFSPNSPIIGASAGVFGVMLAFAYYWPDTPIHIWGIIPVPARILVIITTVLALFSGFSGARTPGKLGLGRSTGYSIQSIRPRTSSRTSSRPYAPLRTHPTRT